MPDDTAYDPVYRQEGYYWGLKPSAMCDRVLALQGTAQPSAGRRPAAPAGLGLR